MSKGKPEQLVRMRVLVRNPPAGVRFAVQRGKSELLEPVTEKHEGVQFEFSLRLGAPSPANPVNFLGEFAQGTPSDRFVYINSGTLAGQPESPWTRRAKLKLASIPKRILEAALSSQEGVIEARVTGVMRDGGPVCASVKPEAVVWSLGHAVA